MLKVSPLIFLIVLTNYCTNQSRTRESGLEEDLKFNNSDLADLNNAQVEIRSQYHEPVLEEGNEVSLDIPIGNYDDEIENYEDYSNFDGRERFEVKGKRERWRRLGGRSGKKKKDKWRKRKAGLEDNGGHGKKTKWKGRGGGLSLKSKTRTKSKGFGGQRRKEKGFWNTVVNKVNRKGGKKKRVTGGEKPHQGGGVIKLEEGWKNWKNQRKMAKAQPPGRKGWTTETPKNPNFDVLKLDEFLNGVSIGSTSSDVSHQETKNEKLKTIESIINSYEKVLPPMANTTTSDKLTVNSDKLRINSDKLPDLWDADLPKTDMIREENSSVRTANEGSVVGVYPIYKKGVVLIDKGPPDRYQLKPSESARAQTKINHSFLKSSLGNVSSPLDTIPAQGMPVDSIGETYRPMTGIQTPPSQTGDEAILGGIYPFSTPGNNMDQEALNYLDNQFDLNENVTSGFLSENLMPKITAQNPIKSKEINLSRKPHTFLDSHPAQLNETSSSHPMKKSSTESSIVLSKQKTSFVNLSNQKVDGEKLVVQKKLQQPEKVVHCKTTEPVVKEDVSEAVIYPTLEPKLEIAREKGIPVIPLFDFNTESNSSLCPGNDLIEIVSENEMGPISNREPETSTIPMEEKEMAYTKSAVSLAGMNGRELFSKGKKASTIGVSNYGEMKFNETDQVKTWSDSDSVLSNNKVETILYSKSRKKVTEKNEMENEGNVRRMNVIQASPVLKSHEMNKIKGEKDGTKEKYSKQIVSDKEEETSLYDEDIMSNFEVKSKCLSESQPKITNLKPKLEKISKTKLSPLDYDVEIFSLENLAHAKVPNKEMKIFFNKVLIKDTANSLNTKGGRIGARDQVLKTHGEGLLDSKGEGGKRRSKGEGVRPEAVGKEQIKFNRKSTEITEERGLIDNDKDVRKGEFTTKGGLTGSELEEEFKSRSSYKTQGKEGAESDAEVALNCHRCQKILGGKESKKGETKSEDDEVDDDDEDEDGEITSKGENNIELGEEKVKCKDDRSNEARENVEPNELGADENYDDEYYADDSFEESERRVSKKGQKEDYRDEEGGGYYKSSEDEGNKEIWQKTLQDKEGKNRGEVDDIWTDTSGNLVKVRLEPLPRDASHKSKARFKSKEADMDEVWEGKLPRKGPFVSYPEHIEKGWVGDRYLKKIIFPGCYYVVVNSDKVGGNMNGSKYRISESEIPIVGSTHCKNHLWGTKKNKPSQLVLLVSKSKEDENENKTTEIYNSVNDSMSNPTTETPLKLCLCLGICLGTMSVPQLTTTNCSWSKSRNNMTTTLRSAESSKCGRFLQRISTLKPRLRGGKDKNN